MRYFEAKCEQQHIESRYRSFVSEGLKVLSKNTATFEGSEVLKFNFDDLMELESQPEETRTADEIIEHIKEGLNNLR